MWFSVSYDRATRIVTALVCGLMFFVAVVPREPLIALLPVLIVALTYAYSPRGYTISEGAIIVRRLIGNVRFPLARVQRADRTTPDDLRGSIRLWASGGVFGYYGLFRTSRLGKCWWYCTNRRNMVVVVTDDRTALFSPDDVDGFLAAIRAVAIVPERPDAPAAGPVQTGAAWKSAGTWIGVAIAIVSLGIVALAFLYSPGPPKYTLTPGALAIHDRFYPVTLTAADVDVAGMRVVDITVDKEWRPTARTNGFANRHYRSGWFRVAGGKTVRMYRAEGTRLVLLPARGGGDTVLIEAAEPEKFVEEVRRMWAGRPGEQL